MLYLLQRGHLGEWLRMHEKPAKKMESITTLRLTEDECAGKKKMTVSPVRDIWIHIVTWLLLTSTIACGIWQMVDSGSIISPLLISVAWAVYGNVAPSLVLW